MGDILSTILAKKREEIAARKQARPLALMQRLASEAVPVRPFAAALQNAAANGRYPVIAEIKRRSPSSGVLCENFDASAIARAYAADKAACLSVLTDEEFFGGCAEDLQAARAACELPVLRKDFMLDEWQIAESRAFGADAILLIVAALSSAELAHLAQVAAACGMAVLVETHNTDEMKRAVDLAITIPDILFGINNRNLKTFVTDLQTTADLLPLARQSGQNKLIVSESGIHQPQDIEYLQSIGTDAFLIGEALMRQPSGALSRLFDAANC